MSDLDERFPVGSYVIINRPSDAFVGTICKVLKTFPKGTRERTKKISDWDQSTRRYVHTKKKLFNSSDQVQVEVIFDFTSIHRGGDNVGKKMTFFTSEVTPLDIVKIGQKRLELDNLLREHALNRPMPVREEE